MFWQDNETNILSTQCRNSLKEHKIDILQYECSHAQNQQYKWAFICVRSIWVLIVPVLMAVSGPSPLLSHIYVYGPVLLPQTYYHATGSVSAVEYTQEHVFGLDLGMAISMHVLPRWFSLRFITVSVYECELCIKSMVFCYVQSSVLYVLRHDTNVTIHISAKSNSNTWYPVIQVMPPLLLIVIAISIMFDVMTDCQSVL